MLVQVKSKVGTDRKGLNFHWTAQNWTMTMLAPVLEERGHFLPPNDYWSTKQKHTLGPAIWMEIKAYSKYRQTRFRQIHPGNSFVSISGEVCLIKVLDHKCLGLHTPPQVKISVTILLLIFGNNSKPICSFNYKGRQCDKPKPVKAEIDEFQLKHSPLEFD